MEKKITLKERFEEMANIFAEMGREDLKDFCLDRIEKIENKKATKKDNSEVNGKIAEVLIGALREMDEPVTMSNLVKVPEVAKFTYEDGKETKNITSQKALSVLGEYIANGTIVRDSKKALYKLVK